MFQRYTDETKRVIYFAAQLALYESAAFIDSTHLLRGLLTDSESRANSIFRLCQLFPEDAAKQSTLKGQQVDNKCQLTVQETSRQSAFKKTAPNMIGLGEDGKRILVYTAREANRLKDYWLDTEHLVLGILREGASPAAARLRAVGMDLETARQRVIESKSSRPPRPDPVLIWVRRRPIGFALVVVFLLGIVTALILLGIGRWGIALTIAVLAIVQLLKSMTSPTIHMSRDPR
jgi:ATP-dependent Clp protease ATP-binding subunit ClpA